MIVKNFIKSPLDNNNYVLIDEKSKEAVLFDCSEPCNDIMDYIVSMGAKLKYIFLTHGHFDHVLGVNYFREKYNVPVYIYKDDKPLLNYIGDYISGASVPVVDDVIDEQSKFFIGSHQIKIIHTAGHSKGSACFLVEDNLFSGDTLFFHTYGRTDLPTGSDEDMFESLTKLFSLLSDDVKVFPGHGKPTSIGAEKIRYNLRKDF